MPKNRLTRFLLAALLLVSLLAVGCGKQAPDPAPQMPPADLSRMTNSLQTAAYRRKNLTLKRPLTTLRLTAKRPPI